MKHLLLSLLVLFSLSAFAKDSPEKVDGATTIDTAMAKKLFDQGAKFVDPRKEKDWKRGRIKGAVHLPMDEKKLTEASLSAVVKKDQPVVFYCNGVKCLVSSEAAVEAIKWGFTKIHYYRDGFPEWEKAGHPTEK